MNTGDWIAAGLNVIQAVAIVAAAVWAYYKFVRTKFETPKMSSGHLGEAFSLSRG
jgi:hypothetical protein